MVAGIIPLDHLAPQLGDAYAAVREAEDPVSPNTRAVLGAIAKRRAIVAWKEEELNLVRSVGATGVRVRAAIAFRLEEWFERPFSLETTFHTIQLMTGHGCFSAYLYCIRRADSPQCFHCGAENDDSEHILIECLAWADERASLVRELRGLQLTLPWIVGRSLDTPGAWAAFQSFSGLVMRAKEDAERMRERQSRERRRMIARPHRRVAPRQPPWARLRAAFAAPGSA
ncbi:uncharacterized protein LOC122515880 [Polistes fuscatus]|uniref:uncharacterized protein LOC122515880 n=1 Tax=Polistes fuscatus TaxID=30207 RepID=UPI001CAA10CD|nr:uncharacterized protein LOC122515880 [Polistes fuscatus]